MQSAIKLIYVLNRILEASTSSRVELVRDVQNKIWTDESIQNSSLNEILSELAYDLDFYEPDDTWRLESTSYYGEKRLEELIKSGIQKIEEYIKPLTR